MSDFYNNKLKECFKNEKLIVNKITLQKNFEHKCAIHKNYCKYVRFLKEVDIIILTDSFFSKPIKHLL